MPPKPQPMALSLATPPTTLDDPASPSPLHSSSPRKRRMSHDNSHGEDAATATSTTTRTSKRVKTGVPTPGPIQPSPRSSEDIPGPAAARLSRDSGLNPDIEMMDRVRDVIQHQFGLEILCKHNELRLIDQEIAKCQIALEQLRRCHLMPYPVNIPTPDQMLAITNGTGPAVALPGHDVPPWAPPYGVTDGPYARHYAKWLIPDPAFDSQEAVPPKVMPESRPRGSVPEGRTTRKVSTDSGNTTRARHGRSQPAQKHEALPYPLPTPKDKAGPCTLRRALDGRIVKLACLDCHRENFSSTQGFINHCRIAHKRDFKSHEEAAIACGHPIETLIGADGVKDGKKPPLPPKTKTVSALHPFARHDMTDREAFKALRARISASMELYKQGKLPGVCKIPSWNDETAHGHAMEFKPSQETPYLSQLLKRRNFRGNLHETVANAKVKIPLEELMLGEDSDEAVSALVSTPDEPARLPVGMRVPARSVKLSAPAGPAHRPQSSKGRAPVSRSNNKGNTTDAKPSPRYQRRSHISVSDGDLAMADEEAEEEAALSSGVVVSNIAPSLVSDDGEYDSDEGYSVSGASDNLSSDLVSDVTEISMDDEHDSRTHRRGSNSMVSPVKLRRDDAKRMAAIDSLQRQAAQGRSSRPRRP